MSFLTAEQARTVTQPTKFGTRDIVFTGGRVSTLQSMISAGLPARMAHKWAGILTVDNTYTPQGPLDPWYFPGHYVDEAANDEVVAFVRADVEKAVDLAIRWKVAGDPDDAAAVVRILTPWTTIQTITDDGDSRLNWSNKWPMFLQAAMLVRDSDAYTEEFDTAMRAMTVTGLNYSTAYKQTENRAMWGVVLNLASGAFLGDRAVFDKALFRWSDLMATCIAGNVPVSEIDRGSNSLYYCNFYLNAATQAAEIARFSGEWLYDWTGPDGSTFRETWQKVAYWTAHPEAFPYWQPTGTPRIQAHVDPLHALWPTDDSQLLIDTYTTTQDYFGFRQGILAYRGRPLFG